MGSIYHAYCYDCDIDVELGKHPFNYPEDTELKDWSNFILDKVIKFFFDHRNHKIWIGYDNEYDWEEIRELQRKKNLEKIIEFVERRRDNAHNKLQSAKTNNDKYWNGYHQGVCDICNLIILTYWGFPPKEEEFDKIAFIGKKVFIKDNFLKNKKHFIGTIVDNSSKGVLINIEHPERLSSGTLI